MQLADYLRYSRGLAVLYTSFIPINQLHYRQSVASYTLLLSRVGCLLCLFYLVPSRFPYWAVKPLFSGSTKPFYLQSINQSLLYHLSSSSVQQLCPESSLPTLSPTRLSRVCLICWSVFSSGLLIRSLFALRLLQIETAQVDRLLSK